MGAVIAIVLGIGSVLGGNFVGILAFIGAFVVSLAVLILANVGSRSNTAKLLLSGMALSTVCSAIANFIVYMTKDNESVVTVNHWLLGSLSGANWTTNLIVLPVVLAGFVFFLTQYRTLNLMLYGDETAITLGTNLHVWRHVYLVVCAAIVGVLVYAAGMVGFVGLVIPHCVRMMVGTDHKKVVPLSALIGAIFLIWVDVCCRVLLKGNELPVGVLTRYHRRAGIYLLNDSPKIWIWRKRRMKVSTQNLHISLGGTEILKGIDFHTKQNSFIGIIGPNGSGKSTLLKCIYRTLKPTSGAVLIG